MLSVGRIFAGGADDGAATTGDSGRLGGRRAVAAGWRYLWEQVAEGAEDYYSADVARGEAAGRWSGSAAGPELGLSGEVTEDQMERVFGRLMHPTEDQALGQEPRHFRSTDQRLADAEATHHQRWTAEWAQREIELVAADADAGRIADELAAHRQAAGERWAEAEARIHRGGERAAIAGFDLTCSPPKSVSVLWAAADRTGREAIWRAHREGVTAALSYVEREAAWSRVGYNGVRQVDTSGLVVASFDHRMSREGDVQIHTHNAVLNRVRCDDGQWRTLDSRALHHVTAAAGAIYDRVREAALERELGVRHEQRKPDGPREIVGVDDDICRLFSTRRAQIEGRLAELVAAYREAHGVTPSPWAVAQMSQWATLQTRKKKERTETTVEALARWETESRDRLGRSLAAVWDQAMAAGAAQDGATMVGDDEALARAVATVDAEKATWTRYDLARQVTKNLHVDGTVDAAALLARVDRLVDRALSAAPETLGVVKLTAPAAVEVPAELRRRGDGTSVYDHHGAERFSTAAGLAAERRVLTAARRGDGAKVDEAQVERCLAAEARPLSADQAAAARQVLTSGRPVEALVGPAGTGKTHTMGAVGRAWRAGGGQVKGLAVAETAARTLAQDAGIATVNTAKLLFEHANRSAEQKAQRAWRDRWGIDAGALVILDEAGMASRQVIDDVARLCQAAGAKLLLVGDHEQLAAPGAGGTFGLVVNQAGAATLGEVRRFAAEWERRASLRLRAGDVSVLADYDLRARIVGGDQAEMETAAFTAALADRARGRRTFLLADTNDAAARLAGRVRAELIRARTVDDSAAVALFDGNWAGVGDRIVTRRNDRDNIAGDRFVANRDVWQVTDLHDDGTVMAARVDPDTDQVAAAETVRLDADYVAEHVQLEYAATVHAAQGGTRATCHAIISDATSRDALYVALTRGAETNRAYVVCNRPEGADLDGATADPLGVLAAILERQDPPDQLAAVAVAEQSADSAASLATLYPQWQDLVATASHQRWETAVAAATGADTAAAMVAGDAWPSLAARLRVIDAAGADSAAILANAARARTLAGAEDVAAVLHWRLRHTEAAAAPLIEGTFAEISPTGADPLAATIAATAAAMDARSHHLAARVLAQPPPWAAQLGPAPAAGDLAGVEWRRRAGIVAGYREAFGLDDTAGDVGDADPIGPMPPAGRPDALAWWRRAAAALDRAEPAGLAALPDERLEALVAQARQAQTDAPPPVGDQLRRASAALAEAHIAEGQALAAGGTTSPAAVEAARTALTVGATVAELEAAQLRRDQWRQATSRLQAQGAGAAAELAGRADARTSAPVADTNVATLTADLATAEQALATAAAVAQRHETLARNWQRRAEQLTAQLAAGPPPDRSGGLRTVAAQQAAAHRIDQLQTVLDRGRLHPGAPRGAARAEMAAELARLRTANPTLPPPAQREDHWERLAAQAADADHRWTTTRQTQLDDARAQLRDSTAIAGPARAEVDRHAERVAALRSALDQRRPPTAASDPGPSPIRITDAPVARVDGDKPARPAAAPDAVAVKEPKTTRDDHDHHQERRPDHDQERSLARSPADTDTVRSGLVEAERQLAVNTIIANHDQARARHLRDTADQLARRLAEITVARPQRSAAQRSVDGERQAAPRADQLKAELDQTRLGRPVLRGPAREQPAEELNALHRDHPTLRHDPVLREPTWAAMIETADTRDQQLIDAIRANLNQAKANAARHAPAATDARLRVEQSAKRVATLRGQLDTLLADTTTTRTGKEPKTGAATAAEVDAGVGGPAGGPVGAVESVSAGEAVAALKPAATLPSIHMQHQLHQQLYPAPTIPAPTIIP